MSFLRCDFCGERINTDEHPEFHDIILDKWACDLCRSDKYAIALNTTLSAMQAERDKAVARAEKMQNLSE